MAGIPRLFLIYLPGLVFLVYQGLLFYQSPADSLSVLHQRFNHLPEQRSDDPSAGTKYDDKQVVIAAVACGDEKRLEEVIVMLKSALLYSSRPLKFVIFTDNLHKQLDDTLKAWKQNAKLVHFEWDIIKPAYPGLSEDNQSMTTAFAPCATLRLFFPQLLADYDRVLYVDNDIIFLQDPLETWKHFSIMNTRLETSVGMVRENSDLQYSSFSYSHLPHPLGGLNSGVLLMDLARMRAQNWQEAVFAIYESLNRHMAFCDQEVLNVLFYYYPKMLYILPCTTNFRPDFCLSDLAESCPELSDASGLVLHGSRGAFHDHWQFGGSFFTSYLPKMMSWFLIKNIYLAEYAVKIRDVMGRQATFQEIYNSFREHDMLLDSISTLKNHLGTHLKDSVPHSDLCYDLSEIVVKQFL